jgi:hypothetical protein
MHQNIASCIPSISAIYRREGAGQGNLDIVVRRGQKVTEVLENINPSEVQIHRSGSAEIDSPWYLDWAHWRRHGRLDINKARNLGFPGNYLPVTIKGKTYFIDAGFKSSPAFRALNIVH